MAIETRSSEEIAELNKKRVLSDAEAVQSGATIDAEGGLHFTEEQKNEAKELMGQDYVRKILGALEKFPGRLDYGHLIGITDNPNGYLLGFRRYGYQGGRQATLEEVETFYSNAEGLVQNLPNNSEEDRIKRSEMRDALSVLRQEIDRWREEGPKFIQRKKGKK